MEIASYPNIIETHQERLSHQGQLMQAIPEHGSADKSGQLLLVTCPLKFVMKSVTHALFQLPQNANLAL